jgi:hypothetical protein
MIGGGTVEDGPDNVTEGALNGAGATTVTGWTGGSLSGGGGIAGWAGGDCNVGSWVLAPGADSGGYHFPSDASHQPVPAEMSLIAHPQPFPHPARRQGVRRRPPPPVGNTNRTEPV